MAEKGSLVDKPPPEIFREMASAGRDGVLRLASDEKIRVVVFERGRPVYAMSNVPDDQLDVLLVRQRKITAEQAALVRRQIHKAQELAPKLVEMEIVDQPTVDAATLDQIARVVQNAMLMRYGEYLIDLSARAPHSVTIEAPIEQWLLDTARSVPAETARALLGPPGTYYVAADAHGLEMSPLDSFILSRVTQPMTLEEIQAGGDFTGEQGLPEIYALFASGVLMRASDERLGAEAARAATKRSVEEVHRELDRLLASYREFDYYDVLRITRQSDAAEIKRAYYALAKQYHPDRYRQSSVPEVREKLEAIFAHISHAYDTLKDEKLRAEYDHRIRTGTGATPPPPVATPAPAPIATPQPPPRTTAPPPPQPAPVQPAAPQPRPAPAPAVTNATDAAQLAEQNFQEGLRRFEKHDVMGAIHLFREAVRRSPNHGVYHLHLGLALATNPRWYKEAEKHLLEASRSDPHNVQIFLKLGHIYQEGGLKKRAEAQYRAVLGLEPYNRIAKRALADLGLDTPPSGDAGGGGILSKFFKKK